ncbi:hypothetical protein GNI_039270 [Gregarina niphandrodes]|uniref:Uncharacterized protein n=1 Tax=Gregarina niphandrodes TaxID=110365 RepID=A0A023BAG3_GRENI|nr:hypothetical protein GNI_039270 [Gregarina niphandrodes]EZG78241.1 hypothetical protein GNI_039270 [Gregarina niphandrodes]|eukprot:XP_011129383.1 hypothetical protein GNI_039270 [Gregarina niphandrodes]
MEDVHAVNIRSLMAERSSWSREMVWREYYLHRQMKCRKAPMSGKGSGLVERWDMSPKGHFDYALQRRSCVDAVARPVWQEPSINLVTSTKHPVKVASTHPDIIKSANVEYMDQSYPRYSIRCKRVRSDIRGIDRGEAEGGADRGTGSDPWVHSKEGLYPTDDCTTDHRKELDAAGRFIGCRRRTANKRTEEHSVSLSTIFSDCSLEDLVTGHFTEHYTELPSNVYENNFHERSWFCQNSKSFDKDLPLLRNQIVV